MGTHTTPPRAALVSYVHSGAGSGASTRQTDWAKEHARPPDNDGRSPTRTGFDARDAPTHYPAWQKDREQSDKRSWQKLAKWQDGSQSDISRGGQNWSADKERWVETFGARLGATEYHKERASAVLDAIDIREYTRRSNTQVTITTELVIVGILSLLIDADIADFDTRTLARDGVTDFIESIGHTIEEYERMRRLLRAEDSDVLFPGD